jgi:sugar/nucleoside kinase (ribokinase family)
MELDVKTKMELDVTGLGNAIVDMIYPCDEAFLKKHNVVKGAMRLIDEAEAERLSKEMQGAKILSGGSVANTIAGLANFGLKTGFIGKVKDDVLGLSFERELKAQGVEYHTPKAQNDAATARCLVMVTPDGERTMNTFLGAAQNLTPADVHEGMIAASKIIYLEGYLWDPEQAKKAFLYACEVAHKAGRKVALSLSDSFCVERYRDEFLMLLQQKHVDIVFANEAEAKALYQTQELEVALNALSQDVALAVVTLGSQGAIALSQNIRVSVPALQNIKVVDTTGAGDLFAAGFLAGFSRDKNLETSLKLGAIAAGEVISHLGARPQENLKNLAAQNGTSL